MVLDITNPNNVDTDLFRRRWEHFEFAYVSELVKGEKNPVWLRKIVNVLFHVNIYKNGLTPPHCQVVMMPPSSDRVVWPNAIRQCFIDILGGVTLIMYDTVEHATAGCEQERSRTTEHKSKFEHINWLVTDHTTVAGGQKQCGCFVSPYRSMATYLGAVLILQYVTALVPLHVAVVYGKTRKKSGVIRPSKPVVAVAFLQKK
jgi:hypothetical protein